MKRYIYGILLLLLSVAFVGCANMSPTEQGALSGGAIGAGLGAGIGAATGGSAAAGAAIGGAAGAVGGAVIGHEQERGSGGYYNSDQGAYYSPGYGDNGTEPGYYGPQYNDQGYYNYNEGGGY